jgi:hypothetical protein
MLNNLIIPTHLSKMESLYRLLEMTPERIANNQQIAYRLLESWHREDAKNAARTTIIQKAIENGTASASERMHCFYNCESTTTVLLTVATLLKLQWIRRSTEMAKSDRTTSEQLNRTPIATECR